MSFLAINNDASNDLVDVTWATLGKAGRLSLVVVSSWEYDVPVTTQS